MDILIKCNTKYNVLNVSKKQNDFLKTYSKVAAKLKHILII